MDKAKTLEMLSGMKFMQRKEETRRRQRFEMDQQRQLEEQLRAASRAGDGTGGMSTGHPSSAGKKSAATILYDTGFPWESYGLARRSFLRKVSTTTTTAAEDAAAGPSGGAGRGGKAKCPGNDTCEEEPPRGDADDVHSTGSVDDETMHDPTAVSDNSSGKRFCVNLRAPALPKGLAKQVAAEKRQKRPRQEK